MRPQETNSVGHLETGWAGHDCPGLSCKIWFLTPFSKLTPLLENKSEFSSHWLHFDQNLLKYAIWIEAVSGPGPSLCCTFVHILQLYSHLCCSYLPTTDLSARTFLDMKIYLGSRPTVQVYVHVHISCTTAHRVYLPFGYIRGSMKRVQEVSVVCTMGRLTGCNRR